MGYVVSSLAELLEANIPGPYVTTYAEAGVHETWTR